MSATVMEPISSKLRSDEKSTFIATCDSIGTTPSNAIRMFVSAFNRCGGFPFDPSNPYGFSDETLQAMSDAAGGRNLIGPFASTDEMWDAILGDDNE
ncbi:type II toxin-antitoxin system RelB/DinJ family antitoxin [Adlercreutzia mucosicola]|uniref:type II toxin-antitoxin system RelB/DinJ family antitoxin n=1 Tax=Adlercreutzia mucosicola TaxID=580026 RepID=UPI0003F8382D|nr:type II toxin-antitoxin system RelB/DinJ family antitoxin [Adlercreutzia mucosicola]MCR2034233.1 type II toxin-antitoxin system RelB/DinJ family antitoxin [Adlercreutzia mucosicola]